MDFDSYSDYWAMISRGELCSLCERPLPSAGFGFQYCLGCAPTPQRAPRRVTIYIDHWDFCWRVYFRAERDPSWYCRLHDLTDEQLKRLVTRVLLAPTERESHSLAMRSWGRNVLHAHMDRRQARLFAWACVRQRCKPRLSVMRRACLRT